MFKRGSLASLKRGRHQRAQWKYEVQIWLHEFTSYVITLFTK